MTLNKRNVLSAGCVVSAFACMLIAAGCSKPEDTAGGSPSGSPPARPMDATGPNRMGGPGGPGGGPGGGRGGPVAENASGAEIYQAKCNCHGPEGKGGRAPVLTGGAGHSDSELTTIIHDGKGKMPAFGTQLTEPQIKKVVAYLKQLK